MRLSMNGMRVNNTAASASAIASMGGYGCKNTMFLEETQKSSRQTA